jgi:tetratricopeptide (TPR) repeat protein
MTRKQTVSAYRKACRCVDAGEFREAVRLGRRLIAERYSGGHEVAALGYNGLGKSTLAIQTLERGVKRAPGVWLLWQLLGNTLSDSGRRARAHACYAKALACDRVDRSSVLYNTAIAYSRQRKYRESLAALAGVRKGFQPSLRIPLEAEMLFESGRRTKAVRHLGALVEKILRSRKGVEEAASCPVALLAEMNWRLGKPRKAREYLWRALGIDHGDAKALWLLREMESRRSARAKYFRLIVEGRYPGHPCRDGKEYGYFCNYEVAAEDRDEALAYVRRVEHPDTADSVKISSATILPNPKANPLGVYSAGPHFLFPRGS